MEGIKLSDDVFDQIKDFIPWDLIEEQNLLIVLIYHFYRSLV